MHLVQPTLDTSMRPVEPCSLPTPACMPESGPQEVEGGWREVARRAAAKVFRGPSFFALGPNGWTEWDGGLAPSNQRYQAPIGAVRWTGGGPRGEGAAGVRTGGSGGMRCGCT